MDEIKVKMLLILHCKSRMAQTDGKLSVLVCACVLKWTHLLLADRL